MKTLLYTFLILSFVSCNNLLEEIPEDRLSQASFYQTRENVLAGLNAIYSQIRLSEGYGTWFPAILNGMSDYAISRGSQIPISEYQGLDGTNIGRTDNIWRTFYRGINSSNIIIMVTPTISVSEADKSAFIAEARFLRGLLYYNLVRCFGGVPIRSVPTENLTKIGGKRNTIDEVYKFIIEDLQFAEDKLPNRTAQAGKPTLWSAKTLLADVYLTRENWAGARDKADEVIKSGQFSLVEVRTSNDFERVFGADISTNTEEIFSFKFARISGQGWGYVGFLHPADATFAVGGVRAHFTRPTLPLIKDWDDKDLRKDYNLYSEYTNRTGTLTRFPTAEPICFRKYRDVVSNFNGNDAPVLRYSDALLIYAEAATQAANAPPALAVERLNMVRRRAYGLPINTPSSIDVGTTLNAQSFREMVLRERAYEFMMEFKRWFDLKRLGTERLREIIRQAKSREVVTAHLLFPIPKQELDNNPELNTQDQNPGY
jgi:starch-binding outer membrane protein, SusD/RagB family